MGFSKKISLSTAGSSNSANKTVERTNPKLSTVVNDQFSKTVLSSTASLSNSAKKTVKPTNPKLRSKEATAKPPKPGDTDRSKTRMCKLGTSCRRRLMGQCRYIHSGTPRVDDNWDMGGRLCRYGENCRRRLSCTFKHPDDI